MAVEVREWSLPVDVTEMILVRIPATDLVRYKIVCKAWRSLISSPDFSSAHLKRSKSDPSRHCLIFQKNNWSSYLDVTPPGPFRNTMCFLAPAVRIVGSVDGLLCIVKSGCTLSGDDIWILNPLTGHVRQLPPPFKSTFHHGSIAFVFWWDSITGDYKLAIVVSCRDNTTVASLWVSSSPETWSEIRVGFNASFYGPPSIVSGCDIVVGDFAYWIVFNGFLGGGNVVGVFVLSLDLKTLSLKVVPFPLRYVTPKFLVSRLWHRDNFYLFVANWKGSFALVEKARNDAVFQTKSTYNVWTIDDDEVWHIESCFGVDFSFKRCISNINGKSILTRRVGRSYFEITLYDVETEEVEMIEDFKLDHDVASAHDFVGSFVSIKGFIPIQDYDLRSRLPVCRASRMNGKNKAKNR